MLRRPPHTSRPAPPFPSPPLFRAGGRVLRRACDIDDRHVAQAMRFEQRDRRVDQLLPCSLALYVQLAAVGCGRILIRQRRFVPQNPVMPLFFSVHPYSMLTLWQTIDVLSKITQKTRKWGNRGERD